jgi:two-component system, OmpR family, response regulator
MAMTSRDDAEVFPRTIDVLVARLRRKLESNPRSPTILRTIRGAGYRFEPDVTWERLSE